MTAIFTDADYLTAAFIAQGADPCEAAQLAADALERAEADAAAERARLAFDAFAYGCAKRLAVTVGHPLPEVWAGVLSEWVAADTGADGDAELW